MPNKKKSSASKTEEIEMASIDVTASDTRQDTNADAEDERENIPPVCNEENAASTTAGSGATHPAPEQAASAYLAPLYDSLRSAYAVFSSASNDIANGSQHTGRMTDRHLEHSLSALPYALSLPLRAGFEAAYYVTQQIVSALPEIYSAASQLHSQSFILTASGAAQHYTTPITPAVPGTAHASLDDTLNDGMSAQTIAQDMYAHLQEHFPGLDEIDDEETVSASDDDAEDSDDDAEDSDGPSDSSGSHGANHRKDSDDSEDSDGAHETTSPTLAPASEPVSEEATAPQEDEAAASEQADNPASQGDESMHWSFLPGAENHGDTDALDPLALQWGNGWLSDTGFALPAPAVVLSIAAAGYLGFHEGPDWSALGCHATADLGQIFAGMMA